MIGLVYLLFFAFYLLISVYVIYRATLYARREYNKGWVGGWLAVFVMYNVMFWDWIPVVVAHKYYCEKDAGFWVYKSPKQWIKENPEMIGEKWGDAKWDRLHANEPTPSGVKRFWSSSRVYFEVLRTADLFHAINKSEKQLVDAKTGEILARSIELYRGPTVAALSIGANSFADYKIWLGMGKRFCGSGSVEGYAQDFTYNNIELNSLGRGDR